MKIEFDIKRKQIGMAFGIAVVCFVLGFGIGILTNPTTIGYTGLGGQLTTADLNREDIGASIILSRFCEGMGLRSSVYWQQDAQGNVYGMPICLLQEQ